MPGRVRSAQDMAISCSSATDAIVSIARSVGVRAWRVRGVLRRSFRRLNAMTSMGLLITMTAQDKSRMGKLGACVLLLDN